MLFKAAFIAMCGGVLAACGDSATRPSDPRPLPPPVLSGRVSDLQTGSPLAGASLTILDGPNASTTKVSDAEGNFFFGVLTPGGFTLRARYGGYDPGFLSATVVADTRGDFLLRPAGADTCGHGGEPPGVRASY